MSSIDGYTHDGLGVVADEGYNSGDGSVGRDFSVRFTSATGERVHAFGVSDRAESEMVDDRFRFEVWEMVLWGDDPDDKECEYTPSSVAFTTLAGAEAHAEYLARRVLDRYVR